MSLAAKVPEEPMKASRVALEAVAAAELATPSARLTSTERLLTDEIVTSVDEQLAVASEPQTFPALLATCMPPSANAGNAECIHSVSLS